MSHDFYKLLNLEKNASLEDIKKAYKKLMLKHHPDKCKDKKNNEFFHQIQMAYQILSDPDKKKKYDLLSSEQQFNISSSIRIIIKKIFNPSYLSDIIADNKIKSFLINGESDNMKNYIYDKIFSFFLANLNINYEDISSIFIKQNNDNNNEKYYNVMGDDTLYESSISDTHASEYNLQLKIYTTLDEIYSDKIKEVTIHRHKLDKSMEEKKILVPLHNDIMIFYNEGDQYINNNNIIRGDIIIKIKCKKHNYIQRINDHDLLLFLPITLYELFYGFKKKIHYFNDQIININSNNPFKDYNFDGERLQIILDNYGLPYYENEKKLRGQLFIYLLLDKGDNFKELLKKYFK